LTKYFVFYNGERPHQSLGNSTPDTVYQAGVGGGAMILDKYPRAVGDPPVPLRSTGGSPTTEARSETIKQSKANSKPGQRRPAVNKVECAA